MTFTAYWPIIEFAYVYALLALYRVVDRRFRLSSRSTACRTIQQFVDLYSGPDFLMHFKYSAILNVVFVTFMYGLDLPMLFPLAFAFFVIQYIAERLCITYFFKKPPMFDEKLNASALDTLKWAPLFMLFFGYWALGNR
eukprot:CAMPEP_0202979240 /NCGR_PEP_ID=MMETSP1396-20130829/85450_1 /ASSEMBLY_ACC=CAM_ASM_000872 /TAXON_ID= /ORGANISM="Pseudokeronopsis sp., Strain Brazil" /LENGTH=138 /DNA_ID=CAMNT_0049718583 /DNA_START=1427 /DNA_END=1843 /DNA_ORIENTATION=+